MDTGKMDVDSEDAGTKSYTHSDVEALPAEFPVWKDQILDSKLTVKIAAANSRFILALLESNRNSDTFQMTIVLSKLVWIYPVALKFAEEFFLKNGSPLGFIDQQFLKLKISGEPKSKRAKSGSQSTRKCPEDIDELLKSLLILLKKLPSYVYSSWDLKDFLNLRGSNDNHIKWLAVNLLGLMLNLSDLETKNLKKNWAISEENDINFSVQLQKDLEELNEQIIGPNKDDSSSHTENVIAKISDSSSLVSVGGIIIKSQEENKNFQSTVIVPINSSMQCVKEIVLHVSSQFVPICLIGPIGCGKSALIQYTASIFGRKSYPKFVVVQMSDQIDSRLLLGSYHSTDLPGQFVWKAGCLTNAILHGQWIVFEDLDAASLDVISLLDSLIDTKRLSVPGYGEINQFHPNFRLFSTSRVYVAGGRKTSDKVGKLWKKNYLSAIPTDELKNMVDHLFPNLKPILNRLIEIYEAMVNYDMEARRSTTSSRIVSLRDFLKLCRRIPQDMDFTRSESAIHIFQDAYDIFISSYSCQNTRETVANLIGTHLGLLQAKTEYFCTMYKPHVNICNNTNTFTSGRKSLAMYKPLSSLTRDEMGVYSLTKRACCLMEMICGSVKNREPILLIGETGVGKTSCIQYLAKILHQKLVVVNLNRQSDSGDLLGGYKPVELKYIFSPLREEFELLFGQTFKKEMNTTFLGHIMTCYANRRWKDLIKLLIHASKKAPPHLNKISNPELNERWTKLRHQLNRLDTQLKQGEESPFAFSFIEGTLIDAIKNGYWILLDEINLATPEMLQCLAGVLEENAQIHLWEKGDETPIQKHSNFHLFAAMNPSTDVGKKDLPVGLRNRFTEFYVEELNDAEELRLLVSDYLREMSLSASQIDNIVQFYLKLKSLSYTTLVDGMGKKPHFSLRTLCRALKISALNLYGSVPRSLYESFCLSFLTQLDYASHPIVQNLVAKYIYGKTEVRALVNQPLPAPSKGNFVKIEGYWIPQGRQEPNPSSNYILTTSVRRNLKDLARIVSAGKLPILIQGETSVGKTSLINYLADASGNKCFRINNHQHTDLQEYVGSYQSDASGKLVFTEGVLLQAMRRGEWIILDELNLAPSEVLEALNRLLDDNRQLFVTETGQTVTAHPRFMLFATQNPPGLYGGRKLLSRAFRNRFVELHFDEIPSGELENILHLRCDIPQSYCKKIIGVMKELQTRRKASAALQGKHGFATLRDLFRWAERYRLSGQQKTKFYDWDQHLADEGYLVLAGKVRKPGEAEIIQEVLHKHLKRKVNPEDLFSLHENTSLVTKSILEAVVLAKIPEFRHIVWTFQMRRLAVLIGSALKFKEPVLLVGETGLGKTTVVQLLGHIYRQKLFSVNCHMHSEGSDFLGGLRPVRDHQNQDGKLFEWVNGPLIEAMEEGAIFLADEISLADDSVLERVNSVLEPERTLLIAEKGDETPRLVVAHEKFYFVATMNPGGDYGKKELSPALRNRLTEIWCEASAEESDMISIIEHNLEEHLKNKKLGELMISFVKWLKNNELGYRCTISIRDFLAWTSFINLITTPDRNGGKLGVGTAVYHGAALVFLDGLGSGSTATENSALSKTVQRTAAAYLQILTENLSAEDSITNFELISTTYEFGMGPFTILRNGCETPWTFAEGDFAITSPTTSQNAIRILRAMQLNKPILLEGSPGVGKTALVSALAKICGFSLVRINLSEQTDISDLFGADLPVEGGSGGHFAWRDGPLLQALKDNSWILLDELNLASQSVLEGLNACLDHRGEIFVPELNKTFKLSNNGSSKNVTRIFGCQNPVRQGGARKGLPKSFLNRFTQVYMDPLEIQDLQFVLKSSFSLLPEKVIEVMTKFSYLLQESVCQRGLFGAKGSPWDFNLRDLIRWAQLLVRDYKKSQNHFLAQQNSEFHPELFVDLVYGLRMRSAEDRRKVLQLFYMVWQDVYQGSSTKIESVLPWGQSQILLTEDKFYCGRTALDRIKSYSSDSGHRAQFDHQLLVLQKQLGCVEAFGKCMEMGWMPIVVGPSSTGKTSVVKLVAELCGKSLKVINPSPEMDAIELLGGFEQADIYRKVEETCGEMNEVLLRLVKKSILSHKNGRKEGRGRDETKHEDDLWWRKISEILDIQSKLKNLPHVAPEEGMGHEDEMKRIGSIVDTLETSYLRCKSFVESESTNLSEHVKEYQQQPNSLQDSSSLAAGNISSVKIDEHEHLEQVARELEQIYKHLKAGIQTGAFQWIDSLLIKAIKSGDWLMIDGANRCTAAVLDRLNSLMEPNGSLLLSERGSIDSKIIEIHPHPDFRLILTMDPGYGEISRAMRNRGVEIYTEAAVANLRSVTEENAFVSKSFDLSMEPESNEDANSNNTTNLGRVLGWTDADVDLALVSEFGINSLDLDALLRAEGLQHPKLRAALVNLHLETRQTVASQMGNLERRGGTLELILCARSIVLQLQYGMGVVDSFRNAFMSTYMRSCDSVDSKLGSWIETVLMSFSCTLKDAEIEMTSSARHSASSAITSAFSECKSFSRLTLCPRNFFNTQLYRIWSHLEVLRECNVSCPGGGGISSGILTKLLNQAGNVELLEDFVMISVFSRILPEDASSLAMVIGKLHPNKCTRANKLRRIVELSKGDIVKSIGEENVQWDVQWSPHLMLKLCSRAGGRNRKDGDSVVANDDDNGASTRNEKESSQWINYLAFVARVYLLMVDCCNTFETSHVPLLDLKKGSLGFAAKNSSFSQGAAAGAKENISEFLGELWNLLSNLDSSLHTTFSRNFQLDITSTNNSNDGEDVCKHIASVWTKGLQTLLWRKRLTNFMQINFNPAKPGEKIMANATLLVKWAGESVSTFLDAVSGTRRGSDVKIIMDKCLHALDYFGCQTLLEKNACFRLMSARKPFSELNVENMTILSSVMEIILGVWSLSSTLPTRRLISFLSSLSGNQCQQTLGAIYEDVIAGTSLKQDTRDFLNTLQEKLLAMKSSEGKGLEELSVETEVEHLERNVSALEEYLRVSEKNEAGRTRVSPFMNPLLRGHDGNVKDSLINYLEWEDVEKFRHLFIDIPVYLVENACLLPYFATKVFLEETESFHNSSLGSRESSQSCLTKVNILLSCEMMQRHDKSFSQSYQSLLYDFSMQFRKELEKWNQNESLGGDSGGGHSRGCLEKLIEKIDDVFNKVALRAEEEKIADELQLSQAAFDLGSSIVQAGGILMKIASDLPAVDPAVEKEISAGYLNEEIEFFETWLCSQRIHQLILTGTDMCHKNVDSLLHPYISESANRLKELRQQLLQAQSAIAVRPEPPEYNYIRKDMRHFALTLASPEKLEELVSNVKRLLTFSALNTQSDVQRTNPLITQDDIDSALIPCLNWIDAQKNFCKKLINRFWYWDITAGFLIASAQVAVGLSILCDAVRRVKLSPDSSIKSSIHQLVTFPIPYKSELIAHSLTGLHGESWAEERSAKKIFMACILSFINEVETQGVLNSEIVLRLHNLSQEIFQLWKKQEEEKARKKELEEAFYVHKGKERTMELSEEAQQIQDIENNFPDFENEFKDLQREDEDCLMDSDLSQQQTEAPQNSQSYLGEFNAEDVALFLRVHSRVIQLVKSHWIAGEKKENNPELNFITPFINRFEEGCLAYRKYASTLDREDESYFIIGANVAVHHLNSEPEEPIILTKGGSEKLYDFYHDPNPTQVQKLNSIFRGLEKRVKELTKEWPEHPALHRILEVVKRIETFKMDSPVMKFLTGLEMLLGVAQEWESCAHQGVSLSLHLAEITNLIISWRKLELQCWKHLLDITYSREQSESQKWWFHLYSAVMEVYLSPQLVSSNPSDFLATLHRFIECSTLGQFHTRLNLLKSVHCHMIALEQYSPQSECNSSELLHPFIWNTYCYYKQFSEQVTARLTSLRTPIEKKMKDFVKISRWNDANYYTVKDSVIKSQKMLSNLVREFKKVLATPVATVLVADVATDSPYWEKKKSKLRKLKHALYLMPENWKEKCSLERNQVQAGVLNEKFTKRFLKLSKIFGKMRNITGVVIERDGETFSEEILSLDELTGSIIQRVHELQSLEVTETAKDKRKKALHNVHNLRRTNLADLFKTLQKLNISYRRGLIHMKNFENNSKILNDFKTEPMDLEAGWKLLKQKCEKYPADAELIQSWVGCEDYFQKCVARLATMTKAFQSPSKELGPHIVARCKGFVADLMNIVSDQKILIGSFSKFLWALRNLQDISDNNFESCQEQVSFWIEKFYDGACSIEFSVKQHEIIVNALHPQSYGVLGEATSCKSYLASILSKCEEIKALLKKRVDVISVLGYKTPMGDTETLEECLSIFTVISQDCKTLEEITPSNSKLSKEFKMLSEQTLTLIEDFPQNLISPSDSNVREISSSLSQVDDDGKTTKKFYSVFTKLLENILVTFQKLSKIDSDNIAEVVGEEYKKEAAKRLIVPQTLCFEVEEMIGGILNVKQMLSKHNSNNSNVFSIFKGMLPLLKQYSMTAQFYLTLFVQYHRTSCKLLSVLSAVFSTLGQKGFCLPSDYENDAMEEGPEIDEQSGMGLGEGDTSSQAQDMSDRLESEDQLEDTLKEGQQIEPADKDLNDDEKGVEMSEDFEGKQQDKDKKPGEDEDDSDKSDGDDEEEADKQMGDVDEPDADKLDEQMWGGSSDEEDEDIGEKDEEKGKGSSKDSEKQLTAKDPALDSNEESDGEQEDNPEKERKGKEFNKENDDNDEDLNDDQVDPYHGQNQPEEEPEALDLPEDLNLDDAEAKDGEVPEENPFDLDANKDKDDITDVPDDKEEENAQQEGEREEPLSDDDDPENAQGVNVEMVDLTQSDDETGDKESEEKEVEKDGEDEGEDMDIDKEKDESEETAVETESEATKAEDKVEPSKDSEKKSNEQTSAPNEKAKGEKEEQIQMKMTEEENSSKNDDQAAGQAESEDGAGHEGKTATNEKSQVSQNDEKEKDAKRKPGETDTRRSLADDKNILDQAKKRLKTVDHPDKSEEANLEKDEEMLGEDSDEAEANAELYQHIKSAEKNDTVTIDNATREESEKQKSEKNPENNENAENPKLDDSVEDMEENKEDVEEIEEMNLENDRPDLIRGLPQEKKKQKKPTAEKQDDEDKEMVDVEGEKVLTYGAQRPAESVMHTRTDLLDEWKKQKENIETSKELKMMEFKQSYLTTEEESAALSQWHELEGKTLHLAQELCEQLRLILEPTLAARLKGDYKTGKRLNMRKVIPYIASSFRKDKIWLRRTQPSKREYQILIALDDSASMADNQSKQMAFSAVAVVARSLGLLEAGQLAVLSFGEDVQLMHPFEEPFTDFSGARLMKQFTFVQRRTRIAQLLEASSALFSSANLSGASGNIHPDVAQLLLIISDGRGVCHEGSETVKKTIKKAREENIFIVFIIVDNPVNKDSILDIRLPIFGPNNTVEISKYMDHFPFPFYLILRDLGALPSVLSDALRQWFELVTSSER